MPKTNTDIQREASDRTVQPDYLDERNLTPRIRLIREFARSLGPGKLLDIGCFDGGVVAPLADRYELHGLDISAIGLARAQERGLIPCEGNAEEHIPFPDDTFDVIVMSEMMEHVVRTDHLLHNVNRVLKPSGHLIVTTPNVATPISYGMMLLLDLPPYMAARYRSGHVRDFTARTLRLALRNHGFEVERLVGAGIEMPLIGRHLDRLARNVPRLATMLVALARKTQTSSFDPTVEIEIALTL